MYFYEYLKTCRDRFGLTQEDLVSDLYHFDESLFKSLDSVTLSRWELGKSHPNASKQVQIIRYFQTRDDLILPCFEESEPELIEKNICRNSIYNLFGKQTSFILNFPDSISVDELTVHQILETNMINEMINITLDLNKEFTHNHSLITAEQLNEWMHYPHNLFLTCEYNKQFFGLLYALRIKPDIFEKLMNFDIHVSDLVRDDFADMDEMGCSLIISFFAMNTKAATLLSIRYFACLIVSQKNIKDVGALTMQKDAIRLMETINLSHYQSKDYESQITKQSFRAPLSDVLVNENIVRMLLAKDNCPKDT